jgi:putative chitobiose transport system permease protein
MKHKAVYFFLLPGIIFISAFALLPMLQIVYYSLIDYTLMGSKDFNSFANYKQIFGDEKFWYVLLNSFLYLLVTPILIVLSLLLALLLRENKRISVILRSVYFLPVVTPLVIAGIIWRWIFAEETGLMNFILSFAGIDNVQWLSSFPQNMISVMIVTVWRGAGYYMMIFLAGLAVLPKELEEAAELDGAGYFQKIFMIILPQLKYVVTLVFVVSAASALKIFTELYVMIPGSPLDNKTIVYYLFKEAFERFDFGVSAAAGVILFIITLGFSYTNIKLMERS